MSILEEAIDNIDLEKIKQIFPTLSKSDQERAFVGMSVFPSFETTSWFIEKGANPNSIGADTRGFERSALSWAAQYGDKKTLELLISKGANPNLPAAFDLRPIHFAALFGQLEAVKYLISVGADPKLKSGNDFGPLEWATFKGLNEFRSRLAQPIEEENNQGVADFLKSL